MEHTQTKYLAVFAKGWGGGGGVFYFVGKYLDKLSIKTYKHENISNTKSVSIPLKRNLCKNVIYCNRVILKYCDVH